MMLGSTFKSLLVTSCTNRFHIQQGRQCTYNLTQWRARATIGAVGKQSVLHNLSVFIALVIQHALPMRRIYYIVIGGLSDATIFPHIISKRHDFRGKKVTEYKLRVFISYTTSV
jgi:hypothetical protein